MRPALQWAHSRLDATARSAIWPTLHSRRESGSSRRESTPRPQDLFLKELHDAGLVSAFHLHRAAAELVVRGTAMYLGLMVIVRVLLRRDIGAVGVADVLFVVIIADAAQNAMSGEYKSIADGMVLVGTLVVWNALLDYLSFRSPAFSRLMDSPARPLIRNGQRLRANLRRRGLPTTS